MEATPNHISKKPRLFSENTVPPNNQDSLFLKRSLLNEGPFASLSVPSSVSQIHHQNLLNRDQTSPILKQIPLNDASNADSCSHPHQQKGPITYLRDPERAFLEIKHRITSLNNHNFTHLLVEVLYQCLHQFSLDDFYNMLYKQQSPENVVSRPIDGFKIDKSAPNTFKLEGLKFCHLIVGFIRLNHDFYEPLMPLPMAAPLVLSVKMQPLLLNFLAIKILLASVKVVDDSVLVSDPLSRVSIYKAYYIVCRRLLQKYPALSDNERHQQNIVLGQSHLGKLRKLIFKNATQKRLGKRGLSIYHYLGLQWNESIIDEEALRLIQLELPEIENHFKGKQTERGNQKILLDHSSDSPSQHSTPSPSQQSFEINSRFVDTSNKFPIFQSPPRLWDTPPRSRPQPSQWALDIIKSSVDSLKCHNIEIEGSLVKFNAKDISILNQTEFLECCTHKLGLLEQIAAPMEAYLHFYLIITLTLFPIVLASDEEVSNSVKVELRVSLTAFVTRLETDHVNIFSSGLKTLMRFIEMMKKLVILNKMLLTRVQCSPITKKVCESFRNINGPDNIPIDSSKLNSTQEQILMRCVGMATNSLKLSANNEKEKDHSKEHTETMTHIQNSFRKTSLVVSEVLLCTPASIGSDHLADLDWLYQSLKIVIIVFHKFCLSDPFVSRLPIQDVRSILLRIVTEFQSVRFEDYGEWSSELPPKTFQVWWSQKTIIHEYTFILSEIAAFINLTNATGMRPGI